MSGENTKIVSVDGLIVGVNSEEKTENEFNFLIEYGTFDIRLGDFVLVKGRNGCGKSTFLRLFHLQSVDYFKVVRGSIMFWEEGFPEKSIHLYSTDELTRLNCMISYIGQEELFLSGDSAYSYIYNACRLALAYHRNLSREERRAKLSEVDSLIRAYYEKYLAASFQCKNYKTFQRKSVRKWSGGQQKMINVLAGVIKAKVCGLKLVVMDEPLNNLDGRNKDILNALVTELRAGGVAIIAITHCQIFSGVNKVLSLVEGEDGTRRATFLEESVPPHSECLEAFH